jgi:DNA-binding NtrC family response regulator
MANLLIIEDDPLFQQALARGLSAAGHSVALARHGLQGLESLVQARPEAVLLDLVLDESPMEGLEILEHIRDLHPELPIIVMTGYGTVRTAVEAMKRGASEFIQKPFNLEALTACIERSLEMASLRQEVAHLRHYQAQSLRPGPLVAVNRAMQEVLEAARRAAPSHSAVLLCGESGTGKGAIARFIHDQSQRRDQPLAMIGCAALSSQELEEELLGRSHPGKLAMAHQGTLLLDQLDALQPEAQQRLLRLLDEPVIRRPNNPRSSSVDARLLSTCGPEPEKAVAQGRLHQGLFFRLNQVSLRLPPLRERPEDIVPLAEAFLRELGPRGKQYRISAAAQSLLRQYPWPGNVRELRNAVERLVLLHDAREIGPEHLTTTFANQELQDPFSSLLERLSSGEVFESVVRRLLEEALRRCGGRQAEASRWLGLSRSRLRYRLKQYGIDPQRFQKD